MTEVVVNDLALLSGRAEGSHREYSRERLFCVSRRGLQPGFHSNAPSFHEFWNFGQNVSDFGLQPLKPCGENFGVTAVCFRVHRGRSSCFSVGLARTRDRFSNTSMPARDCRLSIAAGIAGFLVIADCGCPVGSGRVSRTAARARKPRMACSRISVTGGVSSTSTDLRQVPQVRWRIGWRISTVGSAPQAAISTQGAPLLGDFNSSRSFATRSRHRLRARGEYATSVGYELVRGVRLHELESITEGISLPYNRANTHQAEG